MAKRVQFIERNLKDDRNIIIKTIQLLAGKKFYEPNKVEYIMDRKDAQFFQTLKTRNNVRLVYDTYGSYYITKFNVRYIDENNFILTLNLLGTMIEDINTNPNNKYLYVYNKWDLEKNGS